MFLTRRFLIYSLTAAAVMSFGWLWPPLLSLGKFLLLTVVVAAAVETVVLRVYANVSAVRKCADRFSNGDDNCVSIILENKCRMPLSVTVIDEAPIEMQRRDICMEKRLTGLERTTVEYMLRPVVRGEYEFGSVRVFASFMLRLVERRYSSQNGQKICVYPSYLMMRQWKLLAFAHNDMQQGIHRVRQAGSNSDFDHIKKYAGGDEYRSINWKATARRAQLMVNVYSEERSQHVYCIIEKGRMMQQTAAGMTFLDYAVNASLALSYVVMQHNDKAGVVTFAGKVDAFVPAERRQSQMHTLNETLYNEHTDFVEADYQTLAVTLSRNIRRRSLLVLFCNFATMNAMCRQLSYLRNMALRNRLLVVFFRDEDIETFAQKSPEMQEEYFQTVQAEQNVKDRRLIAAELRQNGIEALLVKPESMTADVINQYIRMRHFL